MLITVQVKPYAKVSKIEPFVWLFDWSSWSNQLPWSSFVAFISSQPIHGQANDELIGLVASYFDLPRSTIRIVRWHRARIKTLEIISQL